LTDTEIDSMAAHMLDPEGEFLARWKVFDRPRLVAEIAPLLYGHDPAELDRVVDRVLASELVVPLIGIAAASDQPYTATAVLATEHTITYALERFTRRRAQVVARDVVGQVTAAKQTQSGHELSAGQQRAVERICSEGRAIDVIVGVAGAGKTTALDVAARALEAAGCQVLGTATSGQAAAPSTPKPPSHRGRCGRCCGASTTARSPWTSGQCWCSTKPASPPTWTWPGYCWPSTGRAASS
jgi:hypothetical protein